MPKRLQILGISAYYHDSAAALLCDGQIVAAAQEERFTRKKHDPGFPAEAIKFCLDYAGCGMGDLDAIAFFDKPLLKFERLLETYFAFAPRGVASFFTSMPVWIREKLFLKTMLRDEFAAIAGERCDKVPLLFPEHHLSHAASAFYPSPFDEAAILTVDGVGEWATASLCHGTGGGIMKLRELHFPHSIGLLYSAFTYFLGFRVNSGEYKLMGLAPYGDPHSPDVDRYKKIILETLIHAAEDGSVWLNQDYFDYATGLHMVPAAKWEELFGFARRQPEDELEAKHCNLGLAIQQVTEEIVLRMAREVKRLTGSKNLCLAGGVALNCVSNGKLLESRLFDRIWIQPAAGDAGGALGAAFAAAHIHFGLPRTPLAGPDRMQGSYLGSNIERADIGRVIRKYSAVADTFASEEQLLDRVAQLLDEGNVIGWVQGRMEWGPRALGGRTILGDPRSPEMQRKMNVNIKYRESFRPFAPSVLAEDADQYFELNGTSSPYMLLVAGVRSEHRKPEPAGYGALNVRDKLYHVRSDLPSITHIDYSARVQTVHKDTNPRYHALISAFKRRTGYGVVVNTSFNVRGEPIVRTPLDAYRCFMRTELDALVIDDHLFLKAAQPDWEEPRKWQLDFVLD
ncbi:carbamoyltransferase family protein [Verrucomicrobiota bacterium sgz303538]